MQSVVYTVNYLRPFSVWTTFHYYQCQPKILQKCEYFEFTVEQTIISKLIEYDFEIKPYSAISVLGSLTRYPVYLQVTQSEIQGEFKIHNI